MVHYHRTLIILAIALLLAVVMPITVSADTHEVGILNTGTDPLGKNASVWCRLGQHLVIPDRAVMSIGYAVWRVGVPTGNITLSIRDVESDDIIISGVWGDVSELGIWPQDSGKFTKVVLDKPVRINGDVRLCVEYYGGNATDYCIAGYYSGDKITGEWYTNYYHYGQWHDIGEAEEGAYFYTWVDPEDIESNSSPMPPWIVAPIVLMAGGIWFYVNKRQCKKHETK